MSIKIKKKKRIYFPETFKVENWSQLEKVLQEMLETGIASSSELIKFMEKYGELGDILDEEDSWKNIRMTQHADDPALAKAQTDFYEFVIAPAHPYFFKLDKKIFENEHFKTLDRDRYIHLAKILENEIEIYREENTPLFVKENVLTGKYGEIYSQITVRFEGEEKTIQEMDLVMKDKDRGRREQAWRAVAAKMLEKKDEFETLFDELKALRIQIARNAGFDNYRDYMHKALGRFDYSPADVCRFHDSIEAVVLPLCKKINAERKSKLQIETLRPWDMSVDPDGKVLSPFVDAQELLAGSLRTLSRLDPEFSEVIGGMEEKGLLDLANRKGKAPGGYSCSLFETGAAFIFMNAVGIHRDVETLLHESGHALHAFARRDEKISEYKHTPSEVAELASMSMELLTLDYLDEFYKDEVDIKKAKREQLEDAIFTLPMVAVVDAFQHWIYLHPDCSARERGEEYSRLKDKFGAGIDWEGLEQEKESGWLRTLHIFEVPFYYIEYAISQLGAIALYKAYKENPRLAIQRYKNFMQLGYSKPVPEIYAAAGIKFDFSQEYIEEMADFVAGELQKLD